MKLFIILLCVFLFGLPGLWAKVVDLECPSGTVRVEGSVIPCQKESSITDLKTYDREMKLQEENNEDQKNIITSQEKLAAERAAYQDQIDAAKERGDICSKAFNAASPFLVPALAGFMGATPENSKKLNQMISQLGPTLDLINGG